MNAGTEPAQASIERLQRELAQSQLMLEDFTFSVSHELRASLRHVNSYLQVLREDLGDGVDDAIGSHLDKVGHAAAHMVRLIDALMELSRVGRAELQLSEVSLERLLSDLRHQLEYEAPGRRIAWRIAPDLPAVHGDMALLGQLLARLLGNALKFTRDCPETTIEIDWERRAGDFLELRIRDNGVGFDPRLQERLFRVFQRLHSPQQFEGIGIGLALVRRIVERHGGTIRASGEIGAGCEISLTLPLAAGVSR